IQTLRDRRALAIQIGLPIFQLVIFAFAIRMNVEHIPTVVTDQSLDPESRAYVAAMTASGYFDVVRYVDDADEAIAAIDAGEAQAGIVIPPDFQADVVRGEAQVLLLVDGSDIFTSQTAYNSINAIAQSHATEIVWRRLEQTGAATDASELMPLDMRVRILYNPNLEDLIFLIPGMVATILQTQTIILTAAAIVREREAGTMEQLLVTPISAGEMMLGKMVPNMAIALINMASILAIGIFGFGVPFQGSVGAFAWLAFLYVFSGLGMGLLVSSISDNQKQSQQTAMLLMLVGLVLGGFMFPRYLMPPPIRIIGNLFPLTYFIPIARGLITKGVKVGVLWEQVVALVIYVVAIMIIAVASFRPRME
ncbi:MAG: ABC transporter permease, partial [Anaerolineae bacterium]|nr:ABC transporter permease [Anaerolineae bacterium]